MVVVSDSSTNKLSTFLSVIDRTAKVCFYNKLKDMFNILNIGEGMPFA